MWWAGLSAYPFVEGKEKGANIGPAQRSNRPSIRFKASSLCVPAQMLDLKVISLILTFEKTIFFNIFSLIYCFESNITDFFFFHRLDRIAVDVYILNIISNRK